jgi:ribosomal protein L37E
MPLLDAIRDRFERSSGYVCEFCGFSYDEARTNCHACGFDVVPQDGR